MDQVKMVLAHLAAHRFWYSLGLAAIFAVLISGGTSALAEKTKAKEGQLETSLKSIEALRSGERPNGKWTEQARERKELVVGRVGAALLDRYKPQEALMTWPAPVAAFCKGLPFGANIEGKNNRNLEDFHNHCLDTAGGLTQEAWQAYYDLKPLGRTPGGKVYGVVEVPSAVALLGLPAWTSVPTSLEAWQYQEELWLKRAVLRAIARCNRSAQEKHPRDAMQAWLEARIKRVDAVHIGMPALDPRALGERVALQPYGDAAAAPAPVPGAAAPKAQIANAARYLEKTKEFRVVPVAAMLVVDQHEITPILREFANAEFNFQIRNAKMSALKDGKLEKPLAFGETEILIGGKRVDNPLYNCVALDIYGACRIFEMPETVKAEREAAAKAVADAAAKAAADANPAAAPAPAPEAKK